MGMVFKLTDDSNDKEELEGKNIEFFFFSLKKIFIEEKPVKKSDYVFSVIANLVLLYIANNLLSWNLSFVTPTYTQVLWAINLSIVVSIIVNILLVAYDSPWFRHSMKALMNIFALFATYIFYIIFPLSFSQTNTVLAVKIFLILLMVILVITVVYEILKVLFVIFYSKENKL
jgi:hypothetical protein